MDLVHEVFKSVAAMNPSKNAHTYWQIVNRKMLDFDRRINDIWKDEKKASIESISISRKEALGFLAFERERIMKLSRADAIKEVLTASKIQNKITKIKSVSDNGVFDLE